MGTSNMHEVEKQLEDLANEYNLTVDPKEKIWQLSVGERQRVEILKALYRNAKLLVLDEPTAVLTPQEVEDFFETLRKLADNGRGLIFISHKLPEVLSLSDRITVLRDGKVSGITAPSHTSREELAEMMVGRQVNLSPNKARVQPGDVQLKLRSLKVQGDKENIAVNNVLSTYTRLK